MNLQKFNEGARGDALKWNKKTSLVKALIMKFDTQSTCYLFYGLCTACGQAYKIREFPQKFKKGVGGGGEGGGWQVHRKQT